ncbi:hypothetical protein QFC21_006943 [Naganishia friedmannii]|uniref:Uncharacterized protein n=1 Tax=Naganishia friedmannii TaxID=89922 RepID=A0ACC2UYZ2_9TREE|nr:hypothetical protein QFC21_006943 [Naganishia friedmannii]
MQMDSITPPPQPRSTAKRKRSGKAREEAKAAIAAAHAAAEAAATIPQEEEQDGKGRGVKRKREDGDEPACFRKRGGRAGEWRCGVGRCVRVEGGKLKAGVKKAKMTTSAAEVVKGAAGRAKPLPTDGTTKSTRKEGKVGKAVVGEDEEDDLAAHNAAADAAGWDSGSVGGLSDDEDDDDMDDSDADSDVVREEDYMSTSPGPSTSTAAAAPGKKDKESKNNGSASLFLPTFVSGFKMGDYDSDPDDDEKRDKKNGKGVVNNPSLRLSVAGFLWLLWCFLWPSTSSYSV